MKPLRIVVMGYLVRGPLGGMAWHHLQYVLGLHRMGHDVLFAEDSDDYPSCYDPSRDVTDSNPNYGLRFCDSLFRKVDLPDQWCYYDAHQNSWLGPGAANALSSFADADLLLNLSGICPLRSWAEQVPIRVFVDTDPVFTQVRHLTNPDKRFRAEQHNKFFTFGENIPLGRSESPDDKFAWQATRQPIVLDLWPVTPAPSERAFTTVMQWDSYPPAEWAGRRYEMKSKSFESFLDLPRRTSALLELALGSPTAPRERLTSYGWQLRDPLEVTRDPWTYQAYVQASRGEFAVAKQGYVVVRSGWFSERSAGYLASGRPCVLQDTGFSVHIPCGSGLIAFSTPEEAIAGIEAVQSNYERHCHAARQVAQEFFDADKVLERLLTLATQ